MPDEQPIAREFMRNVRSPCTWRRRRRPEHSPRSPRPSVVHNDGCGPNLNGTGPYNDSALVSRTVGPLRWRGAYRSLPAPFLSLFVGGSPATPPSLTLSCFAGLAGHASPPT